MARGIGGLAVADPRPVCLRWSGGHRQPARRADRGDGRGLQPLRLRAAARVPRDVPRRRGRCPLRIGRGSGARCRCGRDAGVHRGLRDRRDLDLVVRAPGRRVDPVPHRGRGPAARPARGLAAVRSRADDAPAAPESVRRRRARGHGGVRRRLRDGVAVVHDPGLPGCRRRLLSCRVVPCRCRRPGHLRRRDGTRTHRASGRGRRSPGTVWSAGAGGSCRT